MIFFVLYNLLVIILVVLVFKYNNFVVVKYYVLNGFIFIFRNEEMSYIDNDVLV